jgi:hypothetical protein
LVDPTADHSYEEFARTLNAIKTVIARPFAHPYRWAPFALHGSA